MLLIILKTGGGSLRIMRLSPVIKQAKTNRPKRQITYLDNLRINQMLTPSYFAIEAVHNANTSNNLPAVYFRSFFTTFCPIKAI